MDQQTPERMVRAATLAPSLHNSQPWRFVVGTDRLELHADRARALPATDPDGRWLHVACGAALLNALVAGRASGRLCTVTLLPDHADPDRLAMVEIGRWTAPAADDVWLSRAVGSRHTHRAPFSPGRLPPGIVDRLRTAAATEGCWTHTVSGRAQLAELGALLREAEAAERSDPAYRAELRTWLREAGATASDGVPAEALPPGGPDRAASDLWLRDFRPEPDEVDAGLDGEPLHLHRVEYPLVLVLGTSCDGPVSWLRTGMAMERVLLTATAAGVTGSPLTQALDRPAYRERLRRLVGIDGFPQMVLRLGFPATTSGGTTHRRPMSDVMPPPPPPP